MKKQLLLSHGVLVLLSLLIVFINMVAFQGLESDAYIINEAGQLRMLSYNLAQLNSQMNNKYFQEEKVANELESKLNKFESILLSLNKYENPLNDHNLSLVRLGDIRRKWEDNLRPVYLSVINMGSGIESSRTINNSVDDLVKDIDELVEGYSQYSKNKVILAYVMNFIFIIAIILVTSYSFITTNNSIRKPLNALLKELKELSLIDDDIASQLKNVETNEITKMSEYFNELMYDQLTSALNRRSGLARLQRMIEVNDRRSTMISLCFVDINGLKDVNDKLGHKCGDELIVEVVRGIKKTIRENDFVVRMGGDEFLIVFNNIDEEATENVWDRIKNHYCNFNENEKKPYNISVSHGVAVYSHVNRLTMEELIKMADEKMYEEKRFIKNQLQTKIIR